ncbi:hypothetical protein HG536_0B05740 [Torulaspora globosa]|uniref:Uncharacterized protein n=1 Tax=Torulaspora globosa TaxID=48254 RepID=A0A7G3ZDX3_9SACH|nr:uncharacterized protein HG536_0B05740 [Torulaspora globosa]QLL31709.1 hypothetical protein HG536_0B05740 [Torulaspora globosa]
MSNRQDNELVVGRLLNSSSSRSNESPRRAETPVQSPERQSGATQLIEADSGHESVTDSILAKRKQICQENRPGHSPTTSKSRIDTHNRIAQRQRTHKRHQRATQVRGGLEKMEQFVMTGEHLQELQRLSLQAQENTMTPDLAQLFEQEAQEDLEDDELIEYVEHQEQLDQELQRILSELSIG